MGYSEIYCHICGVSFNIGRLRAPHEPRTSAWNSSGYRDGLSFVDGSRNSWIGECKRDAGCMLVFREDQARESVWSKHHRTSDPESNIGEDERKRLGLVEEEDDDTEKDADYVPCMSSDETGGDDEESMDYEYETPPESCSEADPSDNGDEMSLDGSLSSETAFGNFTGQLRDSHNVSTRKFAHISYQELRMLRASEAPGIQPTEEVMLPLFRPLPGRDEDAASMHGSDASFECEKPDDSDFSEAAHKYRNRKLDHWWGGKLSSWEHPLNGNEMSIDYIWEHVAGPGCLNVHGYNGNCINVEEMQGCNTSQALISKADVEDGWEPGDDDESWEGECTFFLSGLDDHMPSRDMSSPTFYPERNWFGQISAENVRWNVGQDADGFQYAMPFHPTCLEIYKRACLKKYGQIEIEPLASWWLMTSTYEEFHSGWTEAVNAGQEQEWHHTPGDEWLAANPCIIPGLKHVLELACKTRAETWNVSQPPTQPPKSRSFENLPAEIYTQIFDYLAVDEVAKTCLAVPNVYTLAQVFIRDRMLVESPHLWELWCDRPYSRWVGTTSGELRSRREEFAREETEIAHVLEVLEEEGYEEEKELCERHWSGNRGDRQARILGESSLEKPVVFLERETTDFVRLAIVLAEAVEQDQVKGLRNRERIWTQCQRILARIEEFKREGKIRENGTVAPEHLPEAS